MIHKDLYGQKEEIEKKTFLSYDNIPTETRQRVYDIIYDNVLENHIILAIAYIPGKGTI
jgi:lysine/ornithine N-monooxygenase